MSAMIIICFFIIFGTVINAETSVEVNPEEEVFLEPSDSTKPSVNWWKLHAEKGSRLTFACVSAGGDCKKQKIRILESKKRFSGCNAWGFQRVVLSGNEGRLYIANDGSENVYCTVSSTPSYLNDEEISIESSEDGVEIDNKPTCPCGWANKDTGRIVGGKVAKKNEYPFAVLVGVKGEKRPDCGGSIITPYHVLTAAHCTYERENMQVTVGAHNINETSEHTKVIDAEKVIEHEEYDSYYYLNDISLIYLKEKIVYSNFVGPVCIPDHKRDLTGEYIKVMGWGKEQDSHDYASAVLKKTNLRVLNLNVCKKLFPDYMMEEGSYQICTYHSKTDSCSGDSGGPLVWVNPKTNMYTQYALVSFGMVCNSSDPAVNTDVYAYKDWIQEKIKDTHDIDMCY